MAPARRLSQRELAEKTEVATIIGRWLEGAGWSRKYVSQRLALSVNPFYYYYLSCDRPVHDENDGLALRVVALFAEVGTSHSWFHADDIQVFLMLTRVPEDDWGNVSQRYRPEDWHTARERAALRCRQLRGQPLDSTFAGVVQSDHLATRSVKPDVSVEEGATPSRHPQIVPPQATELAVTSSQAEVEMQRELGARQNVEYGPHRLATKVLRSPQDQQNRANFLGKVFDIWIAGFLERSFEQQAWVEVGLENRDDLLPNPWRIVMQEKDAATDSFPSSVTIDQVYDQTRQGQLLIVGEPGAGKTTQMLHLARCLIARAKSDERQPVPVVFNLSSWAHRQLPLTSWLIDELRVRYDVPVDTGRLWVERGQLLPLLDGLDEVSAEHREACVDAINTYLTRGLSREQGESPAVICCRSAEYQALTSLLSVQRAVHLLPLTPTQIDDYFSHWAERVEQRAAVDVLWRAVQDDRELGALACQPLMLSVFTLAFYGAGWEDLPLGHSSRDDVLRLVWNAYVDRMFHRRRRLSPSREQQRQSWLKGDRRDAQGTPTADEVSPWTEQQARAWLTVLAQRMRQTDQTLFSLESLQLDWLPSHHRWLFPACVGTLVAAVVSVIACIAFGVGGGVLVGVTFGLIALVLVRFEEINPVEKLGWTWSKFRLALPAGVIVGSALGLLVGGVVGHSLRTVLMGLVSGIFFGLVNGVEKAHIVDRRVLRPAEGISRSGISGVVVGVVSGLVVGALVYLFGGFTFGVVSGLTFGMLSGAEKVLRGRQQLNVVTALLALLVGLLFGVIGAVSFGVFINALKGVPGSILAGTVFGVFFGMLDGGDAFLLHYFLRVWIWRTGGMPVRLVGFLDEMGDRLLLHKIGGSYVFAHRLLQDHFVGSGAPVAGAPVAGAPVTVLTPSASADDMTTR